MADPERPSSSANAGVAAWEALLRTRAALVPVIAREVEEGTGLPLSWYDVLLELNRAREPLQMHQLGSRVVLSRTRVSRIVDRMDEEGLIARSRDPKDGRVRLVSVTPSGRRALRRSAPVYLDAIDRHFSSALSDEDAAAVAAALERVLAMHEQAIPES